MAQRFGPKVADSYISIVGWPSLRAEIDELIGMGLIERHANDEWSGFSLDRRAGPEAQGRHHAGAFDIVARRAWGIP